ncbi:Acetophenone carboxylase gamma subunit [uncultured Desulfatiglans sp.]|uniref:Acetophenone carboxylase gamma subunit n=1 Tax=Uncultured Desulfatiglans sp. TaxID=1748965 RepID=A0A653AHN8_UNCDX|nr:Acetophenone carboxylase gamma subunit [uncultured Desulfatiglans sp.]
MSIDHEQKREEMRPNGSRAPNTIDVDVGGTFTDCFLQMEDRRAYGKSPTTQYDLSVGFVRALADAARQLGLSPSAVLPRTNMIRYSTTLAMNKLIERTGPQIGLIATEGFEDGILIGKGAQWDDGLSKSETRNLAMVRKPTPIVPRERIAGIKERMDHRGEVIRPLDEKDVRRKVHHLVDQGVRGIVVCLLWAHVNGAHEIRVREIIEEEYPEVTLGRIPVMLSHEVQPKKGEYQRAMTAILDAYLHPSVSSDLAAFRRELRQNGYRGPVLMVHNSGGMGEVLKTTAVDTYNGGHIAGIAGSLEIAKLYGLTDVVTTDMGGTSFDVGVIHDGHWHYTEVRPLIDRWMVNLNMVDCRTIGAGGGSIAWTNEAMGGRLEVGPQSAGAMPGPACYNMGGVEPTVTDADVLLGYINPDFFHGGRIRLDGDLARQAIQERVARPLGMDAVEGAAAMRRLVDGFMGNSLFNETVLRGHDPRRFVLFSFGGAGPTHCCGFAGASHIRRLIAFPFSPVFCAFSGSLMDVRHIYELSRRLLVVPQGDETPVLDRGRFNRIVNQLLEKAGQDVRAEGLNPENLQFRLELDMKFIKQLHVRRILSPTLRLGGPPDVFALLDVFLDEYRRFFGPAGVYSQGGVSIESFVLHAVYPLERAAFPRLKDDRSMPPRQARKGARLVYWEAEKGFRKTRLYDGEALRSGNVIEGPAVVEARNTTTVLPKGVELFVDGYMNHRIEWLDGRASPA